MGCKPLGKVADRRLGPAVCGDLGQRAERVHGGDIDDDAVSVQRHISRENLCRQQRADEVQVEDEADASRVKIKERDLSLGGAFRIRLGGEFAGSRSFRMISACAVDQDITGAVCILHSLMSRQQTLFFQYVCGDSDRLAAVLLNCLRRLLSVFKTEVEDCDFCAALSQSRSHGTAQDAATAGHDGDFVFQIDVQRNTHDFTPSLYYRVPDKNNLVIYSGNANLKMIFE